MEKNKEKKNRTSCDAVTRVMIASRSAARKKCSFESEAPGLIILWISRTREAIEQVAVGCCLVIDARLAVTIEFYW